MELIDKKKLIMGIADWQMSLAPEKSKLDKMIWDTLESVIQTIEDQDVWSIVEYNQTCWRGGITGTDITARLRKTINESRDQDRCKGLKVLKGGVK